MAAVALWSAGCTTGNRHEPSDRAGGASPRIGVYDSRAVAVAFAGSRPFTAWLAALRGEHDKAKAAADRERMSELDAEAQARQKLMHKQAFSTAPVDDILAHISDRLPAIRDKAGVTLLLSKWDRKALAEHPGAELVDVTALLIDALDPNERQRKHAVDIQKHAPISLKEAGEIED
jgi:hypothetical protein